MNMVGKKNWKFLQERSGILSVYSVFLRKWLHLFPVKFFGEKCVSGSKRIGHRKG